MYQNIVHVPEGGPDGCSRDVGVVDIGQARCTPKSHFISVIISKLHIGLVWCKRGPSKRTKLNKIALQIKKNLL